DDDEQDDDDDDEAQDDDDQEDGGDDEEDGGNDEQASNEEEFIHPSLSTHAEEETRDEESFDRISKIPENNDDEGNGEENLGMNMDVHTPTSVAPLPVSAPTVTPSTIATVTIIQQTPTLSTTASSTLLQDLPNFGSLFGFDHRLKTLEENFSEFTQTNQFTGAVSSIFGIVHRYMDQRMNESVKVAVQLQSNRLCEEAQKKMMSFSRLLIKTCKRSSRSRSKNKSRDTVTLKRHHDDDADKDKEPSAGSDRGSKRRREGKEPDSASALQEKATRSASKSTQRSKSRQTSASESATAEEPMQTTFEMEEPSHPEFETGADDQPIVEPSQHPEWFSQQKKPPTPDDDWNKTFLATTEAFNLKECFAFNVSLRMFTRSIAIQRRVEDLQLGVESYQKKLNLTRPDTYHFDLKRNEAYIAYSNPRGFIYQNKDKQNMLMRIDELHKFSDGTLIDVCTALDDRLKGIRMKYLPQSIWRKSDKDRAAAMIQAIDKRLKTRRIMRSLERFVRGRLYEGDFRMLQRTI
nr:hypothetical protein [Tanacetum cinerariifolium]